MMQQAALTITDATHETLIAVTQIYAYHVLHGAGSFEEVPPTLEEMRQRHDRVQTAGLPWLVAKLDEQIVGYCYAAPYRPRPAYRFTIEDSVYIAPDMQGKGIGYALLSALIARCERGPWHQMLSVIGDSANNHASLELHRKLGFCSIGTLNQVGFKFGSWRDTHIMQRALGQGDR
ncbi:N-acetyltransferase family protein [Serratia rhizosphaerae]|nr:GNAT family N-acetyltransferase [Serratia rhizosphaerae]MEB6335796.1 N-acetyltransferase family protein [Serratia rhizosphaerae]